VYGLAFNVVIEEESREHEPLNVEGEIPVFDSLKSIIGQSSSRVVWDCNSNTGDRFHLKLNIGTRPIANK
jgi:hypothetical protein